MAWIGTIFIFFSLFNVYLCNVQDKQSRIDAFLKSWLIIWFYILVSTEILSAFRCLTRTGVLCAWILFFVISCYAAWTARKRFLYAISIGIFHHIPLSGILFFVLLAGTLCCGIIYAPNNWDSLTYHLGRVAMWIQNKSVNLYDTPISRQNYQLPLAEYCITHLSLMTGGDRFAFIVQWMSLISAACGASRITGLLSGSLKAQWRTLFFCASIPMAVYQASSTQNDLVVSAFLVIFARFLLHFTPKNIFWVGVAFGLSLMTKGTAYIYAAVIGPGLGVGQLIFVSSAHRKKIFLSLCFSVLIGILLPSCFFLRSIQSYGKPIWAPPHHKYLITSVSPNLHCVNLLRHAALHLATPFEKMNRMVTHIYYRLFPRTINHPDSTWNGSSFSIAFRWHEDFIGNPLHFFIIVISVLLLFVANNHKMNDIYIYTSTMILTAVVFGSLITWNEWLSRLHLPLFFLFAPGVAVIFECLECNMCKRILFCVDGMFYGLLFLFAALCLYVCNPRPLYQIFSIPSAMYPYSDYEFIVKTICSHLPKERPLHVGILCGEDDKVYLLFRKMNIHAGINPHLRMDFDSDAPYLICFHDCLPKNINSYTFICKCKHPQFRLLKKNAAMQTDTLDEGKN